MQCPVCETENPDDLPECVGCGRMLAAGSARGARVAELEGLEPTQVASPQLAVEVEQLPGLEETRHEAAAGATPAWTADLELDLGRETERGERTPVAPQTATCPWCGAVSLTAICDACGRQKSRYLEPARTGPAPAPAARGETTTCPSCFARVAKEVRCSDCGMPFPLQEL